MIRGKNRVRNTILIGSKTPDICLPTKIIRKISNIHMAIRNGLEFSKTNHLYQTLFLHGNNDLHFCGDTFWQLINAYCGARVTACLAKYLDKEV